MIKKTILVIGSGGREHALAWKLRQSPEVAEVIVAPGNPGMQGFTFWETQLGRGREEFVRLAHQARERGVSLAVIGPDNPLADGIADVFQEYGILTFGPSAEAAKLEASKSFSKEIMKASGVPTAEFRVVHSAEEARKFLRSVPWIKDKGWVIKADGLALGKGVQVCTQLHEALEASERLIQVSGSLVIEERLEGEELSWMALCSDEECVLLDSARDYKRLLDGHEGPNTGGMGAYSPVAEVHREDFEKRVREEVFLPVLKEMKKRGTPFRGVLYAGLMWNPKDDRFWVLEFNVRFGDPEAQVLLPRIEGDLLPWMEGVARGDLTQLPSRVPFITDKGVFVVAAAPGYPEEPKKGLLIRGNFTQSENEIPHYFSAGVSRSPENTFVTSGGRVLGALALSETLEGARKSAYSKIQEIDFEGMHYRRDIGQ